MIIGDNMKKLNNKGYTLVELLAIMAIMVIILGLSVAGYTKVILDSSKDAFIAEAVVHMQGIKQLIEVDGIDVEDEDTVYYFNYKLGVDYSKSPFEEWEDCYVVVTYDEDSQKNSYYWTAIDKDGWGVKLGKKITDLDKKDVVHNKMDKITLGNTIGGRNNVVIYSYTDGSDEYDAETRNASNQMTIEEAESCFDFKKLSDGTYEITDYKTKCGKDVNVPSEIDGKVVTSIGENAFRNKDITSINIYYGIKELKNGAIQENKSLKEMKISSTVTKIGDYAFYNCGLKKVSFPEGLEEIGAYSFAYNEILEVRFPKTLKKIGAYAFLNNKLEDVDFNSSLEVNGGAFSNNDLSQEAGFIYAYNADGTPDYTRLVGYGGGSNNVVIPAQKNGVGLLRIESNCFASVGLESVIIPEGVQVINGAAFYNNKLKDVVIPSTVTTIGSQAFRANYLTEINIPAGVTSIGNGAFTDNCVPLNSPQSFIYKVGDESVIVSGASGRNGCSNATTTGVLRIPAKSPNNVTLKRVVENSFIGGKYTGIELPTTTETPSLTLEKNFILHNNPGSNIEAEGSGYVYGYVNGVRD